MVDAQQRLRLWTAIRQRPSRQPSTAHDQSPRGRSSLHVNEGSDSLVRAPRLRTSTSPAPRVEPLIGELRDLRAGRDDIRTECAGPSQDRGSPHLLPVTAVS